MSELLRTPKWWFRNKKQAIGRQEPAAPEPTPVEEAQLTNAPAPSMPGIDLRLDPERQRIRFNVTYSSAIVAGFALVVVVSLAYVIGSKMSRGPSAAMAGPTSEQLRQGPARPAVLDVKPGSPVKSSAMTETEEAVTAGPNPPPQVSAQQAPAVQTAQRVIGRNYVVIQSYPDEQDAKDAIELLARNGIPATIEQGLTGFPPKWFSVVGLAGFDRMGNNPEYERYIRSITAINDSGKIKSKFKRFEPLAIKWKG